LRTAPQRLMQVALRLCVHLLVLPLSPLWECYYQRHFHLFLAFSLRHPRTRQSTLSAYGPHPSPSTSVVLPLGRFRSPSLLFPSSNQPAGHPLASSCIRTLSWSSFLRMLVSRLASLYFRFLTTRSEVPPLPDVNPFSWPQPPRLSPNIFAPLFLRQPKRFLFLRFCCFCFSLFGVVPSDRSWTCFQVVFFFLPVSPFFFPSKWFRRRL